MSSASRGATWHIVTHTIQSVVFGVAISSIAVLLMGHDRGPFGSAITDRRLIDSISIAVLPVIMATLIVLTTCILFKEVRRRKHGQP